MYYRETVREMQNNNANSLFIAATYDNDKYKRSSQRTRSFNGGLGALLGELSTPPNTKRKSSSAD